MEADRAGFSIIFSVIPKSDRTRGKRERRPESVEELVHLQWMAVCGRLKGNLIQFSYDQRPGSSTKSLRASNANTSVLFLFFSNLFPLFLSSAGALKGQRL